MMIGSRSPVNKMFDRLDLQKQVPAGMSAMYTSPEMDAVQPIDKIDAPMLEAPSYGMDRPKMHFNPWDIVGAAGDAMASYGGLGTPYRDQQRQNHAEDMAQEQYNQRAAAEWSDFTRKEDYKRENPEAQKPHYWKMNDGSLGATGADGQPQVLYKDPNPKMQWVPDGMGGGSFASIYGGGQPAPQAAPQNTPVFGGWADEGGQTPPASGNFAANRLDRVTASTESNNRDYANGRPVTSSAGAKFAMQVMPATARDPGFGLRAANPNNAEDMNRLGREYRAKMEQRYGGDYSKMWAAYNAGPGAVDKAIQKHGSNWLSHVPQETKDYVRKNVRKLR